MLQSKETADGENETPRRCHPETQAQSLRPASEGSGESANQVKSLKNEVILSVVISRAGTEAGTWTNSFHTKTKPALLLCQMAVVSARVPSVIFWRA